MGPEGERGSGTHVTGEEEGAKSDESGDSWRRYGGRLQCAPASDSACRRRQPSAFGAARCGSKGLTEREEVAVWAQRMKPEEAGPNHHQKKKKKKIQEQLTWHFQDLRCNCTPGL